MAKGGRLSQLHRDATRTPEGGVRSADDEGGTFGRRSPGYAQRRWGGILGRRLTPAIERLLTYVRDEQLGTDKAARLDELIKELRRSSARPTFRVQLRGQRGAGSS